MSRAAVKRELVTHAARGLKMPGLLRAYEQLARQAREEHWSHEEYRRPATCARASPRVRDFALSPLLGHPSAVPFVVRVGRQTAPRQSLCVNHPPADGSVGCSLADSRRCTDEVSCPCLALYLGRRL